MLLTLNFIKLNYILISLFLLILITIVSLTPFQHLPSISGSDKTHHFISYALLLFPVALAKPKHWMLIALFFACWSGIIELIQPSVNRHGEWLDLLANCIGLMCGFILARITHKIMTKC